MVVMVVTMMDVYSELASLAIKPRAISHYLHALYKRILTLLG